MVQKQTKIYAADNSGVKSMQVIHVVGSTGKRFAFIGDIVKCAVKVAVPGGMVKKGDMVTAVLVRAKAAQRRSDGSYIRFGQNAGVLIKDKDSKDPIGTRIFGPIAREIRACGFAKIVSLAPEVL